MEEIKSVRFNDQIRHRTMDMASGVYEMFHGKTVNILLRQAVKQVVRSSSSVAANYRAAVRARSDAEFYAKICIVVEECDETLFWLDYITRADKLGVEVNGQIYNEVVELLKIFSSMKKTMKGKVRGKL